MWEAAGMIVGWPVLHTNSVDDLEGRMAFYDGMIRAVRYTSLIILAHLEPERLLTLRWDVCRFCVGSGQIPLVFTEHKYDAGPPGLYIIAEKLGNGRGCADEERGWIPAQG